MGGENLTWNYEEDNRFNTMVLDGGVGDNHENNNRFKCEMLELVR